VEIPIWTTTRLKKAGSSFGTGAVIVMDETTCMVRALERLARFYMSSPAVSARPAGKARVGWTAMLKRIIAGEGRSEDFKSADGCRQIVIEGHTILRPRRCGCLAGAELLEALQAGIFNTMIEHKGRSIMEGATHVDGRPAVAA